MTTEILLNLAELRSAIDRADTAYYRGQAIMPDAEYDALKRQLRDFAPDDPRLTRVGPPYSDQEIGLKTKHSIPMGSLDNTDGGILGVDDWYEGITAKLATNPELVVSLKIDGSSIAAEYERGSLVRVLTRGNGEVGEDITKNARMFHGLPSTLPVPITCTVRGEAILHRADFDRLMAGVPEESRSNPRNVGNGIIGRDSGENSQLINVYAFNIVVKGDDEWYDQYPRTEFYKFHAMKQLGFQTAPHYLVGSGTAQLRIVYDRVLADRSTLPYDIDGLVVTINDLAHQDKFVTKDIKTRLRPKYARAIKFPAYTAVTKVTGVTVTVGHNRVIVPTLDVEPVRIGAGITVDSVIVTNYDEIARQGVAIGDTITVALAGDIIPNCAGVVAHAPVSPVPLYRCPGCGFEGMEDEQRAHHEQSSMPSVMCGGRTIELVRVDRVPITPPGECPCCGAPTTRAFRDQERGANLYCTNPDCPAAKIRKIGHWLGTSRKGIGILGIGDAMIQALWDAELVKDPADLYTLSVQALADLTLPDSGIRVGESRAQTVVDNIQAKRELPLHVFLGALGIDLLGSRRAKLLIEAAEGRLDTIEQWLDDANLASLDIPGLRDNGEESTTRRAIRDGLNQCRPLIRKLLSVGVVPLPESAQGADPAPENATEGNGDATTAKSPVAGVSFCFTGTRDLLKEVEKAGGVIKSGVSKGLQYLVQKDASKVSNKSKKAEQYGTKVISLDTLRAVLAGEAQLP